MSAERAQAPPRVGVGDIFASAFTRFGAAFATFGLLSLALAALPALVYGAARLAGAHGNELSVPFVAACSVSYLALVGAVTALIGGRLRATAGAIAATAALAAPPLAAIVVIAGRFSPLVLVFVLPVLALAPAAAGAGDAAWVAALRRALEVSRQGYGRALVATAALLLLGAVVLIALVIALSPFPPRVRGLGALLVWTAVYGPISALVFRALYGALSGRLVVRRPAGREPVERPR